MVRIVVVGAGWYGLHIAFTLKSRGHEVTVLERNSQILSEAGSLNQLRIHRGFHYLRDATTRRQSNLGYQRFLREYPKFCQIVEKNTYLIPAYASIIDFETALTILDGDGIPYEVVDASYFGTTFRGIEHGFTTDERLFLPQLSRVFFARELECELRLNTNVDFMQDEQALLLDFDFVIDATYLGLHDFSDSIYESTFITKLQKRRRLPFGALTLIDGPFWSIYPTEHPNEFSLSHVTHGVLHQSKTSSGLEAAMQGVGTSDLRERQKLMIESMEIFWPDWGRYFDNPLASDLSTSFTSKKLKSMRLSARREATFSMEGRWVTVRPGKLDAVFELTDGLVRRIESGDNL